MIVRNEAAGTPAWERLQFIETGETDMDRTHYNFWSPGTAKDYSAECAMGRKYAADLVNYMRDTDDISILPRIIGAMPVERDRTGFEIGFLFGIAIAAVE